MTKVLSAATVLFAFTIAIFSCEKEAEKEAAPQSAKSTSIQNPISPALRLAYGESTDSLTDLTRRFGVSSITLEERLPDPRLTFRLAASPVYYNGVENFSLDSEVVTLTTDHSEIVMTFGTNEKVIRYNENTKAITLQYDGNSILLDDQTEAFPWATSDESEFIWGLIILDELINQQGYRTIADLSKINNWDIINGGFSRGKAERNTRNNVLSFLHDHPGCYQVGGIDVSCVWDNHLCVGTAYVYCP